MDIEKIVSNACVIVDSIAFEVAADESTKRITATDLNNPAARASFIKRGENLVLSVSSFVKPARESALLDAVRINQQLLIDEVQSA